MNELIVKALIEIPAGSKNKYEVDKKSHRITLDRPLYSAVYYPAEYGYIEDTLANDGDPIDILTLATFPTFPGCIVESRVIGMLEMVDDGEEDVKLIAVSAADPRYEDIKKLDDLPAHTLKEIKHFFDTYKLLQNKKVETGEWKDVATAEKFLQESIDRHLKNHKVR